MQLPGLFRQAAAVKYDEAVIRMGNEQPGFSPPASRRVSLAQIGFIRIQPADPVKAAVIFRYSEFYIDPHAHPKGPGRGGLRPGLTDVYERTSMFEYGSHGSSKVFRCLILTSGTKLPEMMQVVTDS